MPQHVERVCRDCGQPYTVNPEPYVAKRFSVPTRCDSCREARRHARLRGVVRSFDAVHGCGEIVCEGCAYFFTRRDLGIHQFTLLPGMTVSFLLVADYRGHVQRASRVHPVMEIARDAAERS